MLDKYLSDTPLVAILRGVSPEEVVAITGQLIECGYTIIEVPLTSPDALKSIALIAEEFGGQALIGAGTVTQVNQVTQVFEAGGELVFSPNCDLDVIRKTKELNMVSMPGCCTPSEAFSAMHAGADALKFFPADLVTPSAIKAMRAVLPTIPMLAVGGINNDNMQDYLTAGATGFGIGSSLYKVGKSAEAIVADAKKILNAFHNAKENS